jgi:hypothetical protein
MVPEINTGGFFNGISSHAFDDLEPFVAIKVTYP